MSSKKFSGRYKVTSRGTRVTANIKVTQSVFNEYQRLNKIVEKKRQSIERKALIKGYSSDAYYGKQIKSLHFYKSQEQFNKQMKKLRKIASADYIRLRDDQYIKNFKDKIDQVFDKKYAREMKLKISKLGKEEFIKRTRTGEIDSIAFLYVNNEDKLSESDQNELLKQVNTFLTRAS